MVALHPNYRVVFTCIIIADVLGVFGRGYFSSAQARSEDGLMDVKYERVERFSSPSILRIQFGANAIQDGKIELWVSDSLLKPLGNQRVIPQPESSVVGRRRNSVYVSGDHVPRGSGIRIGANITRLWSAKT